MAKKKTTTKRSTKKSTKRSTPKRRKKSTLSKNNTILAIAVAAAVIFLGILFNYHFVLTTDGLEVLKKDGWGPKDTFVDTRNWGPFDWLDHPDIVEALTKKKINEGLDRLW